MMPGVDYTESFSPVTTDVGVCVVVRISLHYINEDICNGILEDCWMVEMYDVKAAFLNAKPRLKMYI